MANTENLGSKKVEQTQENENIVTKILAFFNKYQNIIYGVIIGVLVIVLAILAFNRFYVQKKNAEAAAQIQQPIHWLTQGDTASLKKALEGDGENDGFLDIASGYKLSKTSNTANYYAGLTYLKLGQKDEEWNISRNSRRKRMSFGMPAKPLSATFTMSKATKPMPSATMRRPWKAKIRSSPLSLFSS